jgi:DNA-binding NarL/FixJ family response regulator
MMRHFFIAPEFIHSPRWLQAFPQAIVTSDFPKDLTQGDCCWCYLQDNNRLFENIQKLPDGVRVIVMTAMENFAEARQVLAQGASGYVHYLAVPQVLLSVTDAIKSGGIWLGADLMRKLMLSSVKLFEVAETSTSANTIDESQHPLENLTERERDVANHAAQGKTNKEIARDLGITERTVKAHLGAVFEKCRIRDRLHLVLVMSGKYKS